MVQVTDIKEQSMHLSYLGSQNTRLQDNQDKSCQVCISKISLVWWFMPVIPHTQEVLVGLWFKASTPKLVWETI
jgi:hypothetical protein